MAITVKHSKVSTIPDDADTSLVRPSDWNADHTLTGTIPVDNGGTGASTLTGYVIGNGTSAMTASTTIPSTDVSGLGTMATQNANAVAVTGGTINNASIGATTATTGKFTTLEATGTSSLGTTSAQYIQAVGDALYPQVKAVGSGTNIPLVLQPKGTGALQAQLTDSTATGGNARGAYAVDWQTSRAGAAQIASGTGSIIGGGVNNTNTSTYGVVGGGANNTNNATNYGVLVGGQGHTVSGQYSAVVGGTSNTSTGWFNFIGGGASNSGTANGAVTTQSGTMNATTAVTLAATNAAIKVGQYITGTSIAGNTYVAAISGTSLTLSQAASGSSTSTLSFYTPHGVVVGGGNNQATGSYSFIGGGGDAGTAANRNVASGDYSVVVGGQKNVASGIGSFVGGGGTSGGSPLSNTASGVASVIVGGWNNIANSTYSSILGGQSNNAIAVFATIGGGQSNYANGLNSTISGGSFGTTRAISGNQVFAAHNSPISQAIYGASQGALLILGRQTTDATATVLTSDTSAASTTNQVILPNNSAYYFKGSVIAGVTGAGNTKGWSIEGVIKRGANAASTAIVGTPTVVSTFADAGAATWAVTATADTTNGGLKITVTGQAATTIRWVCELDTTEMTF